MSTSFKKILPLLNRVVIRKLEQQTKTTSGIIVTKTDEPSYGVVLETGPGQHDGQGKLIPMSVKTGDKVMLPDYGGQRVKLNEAEVYIYRDTDLIGKME